MKQDNIKVAVRLRPLLEEEIKLNHKGTKLEINNQK